MTFPRLAVLAGLAAFVAGYSLTALVHAFWQHWTRTRSLTLDWP